MEMNRIDGLIKNPEFYYDDLAVEGWIKFCENELTLTDGADLHMLDTFKLWGEEILAGIISLIVRFGNQDETVQKDTILTKSLKNAWLINSI